MPLKVALSSPWMPTSKNKIPFQKREETLKKRNQATVCKMIEKSYRVLEIDRKERNRSSRGRKPKNERENEMDVERRRRGARE